MGGGGVGGEGVLSLLSFRKTKTKDHLILFMFQTVQFHCQPSEIQRAIPEVLENV